MALMGPKYFQKWAVAKKILITKEQRSCWVVVPAGFGGCVLWSCAIVSVKSCVVVTLEGFETLVGVVYWSGNFKMGAPGEKKYANRMLIRTFTASTVFISLCAQAS